MRSFPRWKLPQGGLMKITRIFTGKLWDFCSLLIQNVFSMPIKLIYQKAKFHLKYVGREKLKECRKKGYFIYGNHTQPFADTFIPSVANYPHRNFFIVNPANVSMPGLHHLVEMLGAIPIPCDFGGMKHFMKAVEEKIRKNNSVTIYPEAISGPIIRKSVPLRRFLLSIRWHWMCRCMP